VIVTFVDIETLSAETVTFATVAPEGTVMKAGICTAGLSAVKLIVVPLAGTAALSTTVPTVVPAPLKLLGLNVIDSIAMGGDWILRVILMVIGEFDAPGAEIDIEPV